ncbi:MAG: lysozyme inhibitor LprI family protein [Saprospiraceae bacterium]
MKSLMIILLSVMSLSYCYGQTQAEMNKADHDHYVNTDIELNSIYKKVINEYAEDTAFIKNLKASQRLWVKFRDAEMKMRYPDREPGYYGSMQPSCRDNYLAELTEDRINTLKEWIEGAEEGDVCSGSVKTKE